MSAAQCFIYSVDPDKYTIVTGNICMMGNTYMSVVFGLVYPEPDKFELSICYRMECFFVHRAGNLKTQQEKLDRKIT